MRFLLLFLVLVNVPLAVGCDDEDQIGPKVLMDRWQNSFEEGVTIYYPSEYNGVPVSYIILNVEDESENYISADLQIRPAEEDFSGIDISKYKISHIYISEEFLKKAQVSIKYEYSPKNGEPITCGPLPHLYQLSDLLPKRAHNNARQ
ncbi:hypothetical protein [Microbulbifer sp. ALW1]|uniref:hypothetical protein n=1 Tax=Microbulbifer sp. (strain ALW1) TaxID=1516059 RepID=UPI0013582401|nr:hypothetical protein [Microbulbifer sp. ALW1]